MLEGNAEPAGPVLVAHAARIAAAWSAASSPDDPPIEDPEAVVAGVIRALTDPTAVAGVATALTGPAVGLETCVHRISRLRQVLHRQLGDALQAGELGGAELVAAEVSVDAVLDGALELAAGRLAGELEEAAFLDPLTGMANRRAFDVDLRRAVANADRAGAELTVAMIDLDGLKALNDSEGHAAGDASLRDLADKLRAGLRSGDSAYRIGGDEFVLILPGAAEGTAEVVLARTIAADPPAFSWGAAAFPADGGTPDELVGVADDRLYAGRRSRRGLAMTAPEPPPRAKRAPRPWGLGPLLAAFFRAMGITLPGVALALFATGNLSFAGHPGRPHPPAGAATGVGSRARTASGPGPRVSPAAGEARPANLGLAVDAGPLPRRPVAAVPTTRAGSPTTALHLPSLPPALPPVPGLTTTPPIRIPGPTPHPKPVPDPRPPPRAHEPDPKDDCASGSASGSSPEGSSRARWVPPQRAVSGLPPEDCISGSSPEDCISGASSGDPSEDRDLGSSPDGSSRALPVPPQRAVSGSPLGRQPDGCQHGS